MKRVLITGTAGFIGFHLAELLLKLDYEVIGLDGMTKYYDVELKKQRHKILLKYDNFNENIFLLENKYKLSKLISKTTPNIIIHLAAQAGVRHSIKDPRSYVDSNILGFFNLIETAIKYPPKHILLASTSSVYGANKNFPFLENDKADLQMSFYAASKKANEVMAHSLSHINNIPITVFRFFTVYGPWGRPDMAAFKFTRAILDGKPIDVYNNGLLWRDFTYISDLVNAIQLLIDQIPGEKRYCKEDSLSPVAPFRIVNIGNSNKVKLEDFISNIENALNKKAIRNYKSMQKGDVKKTWANTNLLKSLTGYQPNTPISEGLKKFCEWYKEYYSLK